jgi:F0F1-type ATP synthase assembly protein I
VKEWVKPVQFLLVVGWYVALSLLVPIGIGYWLDQRHNKTPLFTFIGLGVGSVIAFFGLIRMLLRYQAEQEKVNSRKEETKQGDPK